MVNNNPDTPDSMHGKYVLSRRGFIIKTGAVAAGMATCTTCNGVDILEPPDSFEMAFGVITDLHYAEKDTAINRYYRESAGKLHACIETFNSLKPSFIIELGDFVDKAEKVTELAYLETINTVYKEFTGERHYVLGNHDVATFSKEEFIRHSGARGNYYSFDIGADQHCIVLDANYNKDGSDYNAGNFDWTETYIHETQREWLKRDLDLSHTNNTTVFIHQNLHDEHDPHGVKNAPEVRRILEKAENVRLVMQGHNHQGGYAEISGIHYITLRAAVEGSSLENNAYAMVYLLKGGNIQINGYMMQKSLKLN